MSNMKLISVVIPAFNCEKTISDAIKGVLLQKETSSIELIVVDDGSRDGTSNIIKGFPEVKYVYQENSGPAVARNRGANEAAGELLFFTDADCIPEVNWIESVLCHFDDPDIAVVSGSYSLIEGSNLLSRCIHQEILYRHSHLVPRHPKSFGSYNFCVRRNVFLEVGGFNCSYRSASGEDNDLSYRILNCGYKIYFERECLVKHHHTSKVSKYLKEQFRHGYWRAKIYVDHPQMVKGDDYTFWKDIVEPPAISMLFVYSMMMRDFHNCSTEILLAPFFILLAFEIIFAFFFTRKILFSFFWGFVMFMRAIARTFGFLFGIPVFFVEKSLRAFRGQ